MANLQAGTAMQLEITDVTLPFQSAGKNVFVSFCTFLEIASGPMPVGKLTMAVLPSHQFSHEECTWWDSNRAASNRNIYAPNSVLGLPEAKGDCSLAAVEPTSPESWSARSRIICQELRRMYPFASHSGYYEHSWQSRQQWCITSAHSQHGIQFLRKGPTSHRFPLYNMNLRFCSEFLTRTRHSLSKLPPSNTRLLMHRSFRLPKMAIRGR